MSVVRIVSLDLARGLQYSLDSATLDLTSQPLPAISSYISIMLPNPAMNA